MTLALPIDARIPEILASLRSVPNLVLVAEPGAGKTTRLPRALLEHGLAGKGEILVLEPRRIAARMAADFVASELGEKTGERVGYQVRFERKAGRNTRLTFLTEGLLSRRLAGDPTLAGVSAVVFDEFHERHLHADLGLAMLREAQKGARRDLKLVVMSATIDAAKVAGFLEAPVVSVEGRAFPVAIEHEKTLDDRPLERKVASAVRRLVDEGLDGDVLVFLPGAAEIRRAEEACKAVATHADLEVVMLHGDLPAAEQDRAVRAGPKRKIILSTNVAETSVTIPTVVAVVDSGLARIAKHSPWTGLPQLETAKVSQASCVQRAGRAGRVRAGRCLRLYTQHDYDARPKHDDPEIRRADLAETLLLLASIDRDARTFPWFEPPQEAALAAASDLLSRLGALGGGITELGRAMLELPLHPRLARLVLAAADEGAGPRGCLVAALLGERDILLRGRSPHGRGEPSTDEVGASDLLHRVERFESAEAEGFRGLGGSGIDQGAIRGVARARDQLVRALGCHARPVQPLWDEEEVLLRSILLGFPDRVGKKRDAATVVFAAGGSGTLSPASVVKQSELVVAVDAQKQAQGVVIRMASAVEAEWLLELFPERVVDRRDLRFDPKTQQVEQVSQLLYDGLVLDESVRRDVSGDDVAAVLADAALSAGIEKFWDRDAVEGLRMRLSFAAKNGLGIEPPDEATVRAAIRRLADGARSFADLRGTSLVDALLENLPTGARSRLSAFAPEAVAIPGRPRAVVHYEADRPPWIESRMQDFFGAADGPRVADGRVPLVLHLLAPNHRAVQVTTDLAGFWQKHYPSIRKELMRQYPRHYWPEDPRHAEPRKPGQRG
ncbi:MAG: ATP-dependent helicase HrpB [Polyangiales bacterium]